MNQRDYTAIAARLSAAGSPEQRMQAVVDALWAGLRDTRVSWVGFYLPAGAEGLVLGPRRDKPACSPIGLRGVCGRAFTQRQVQIVRDVRELSQNYVPCDPRDLSEIVLPLLDAHGDCQGVLDLDSHDVGAFTEADAAGLQLVLRAAGLTV